MPYRLIVLAALATTLSACTNHPKFGDTPMNDQTIGQELKALQARKIYFGHQSVGNNIIEGVRDILAAHPDIPLNVVSTSEVPSTAGNFFVESPIGKNTQPETKCAGFTENVRKLMADSLELAAMKFCYVDFNPRTEVKDVFRNYVATIDSLRAAYPRLTFVHITVPLTVRTPGWKKVVKRILGKDEVSDVENTKRNEFNDLLRAAYHADPLFDLAAVESTYPDGSRSGFEQDGKTVYTLIADLSDDGTHLNKTGRDRAAREFLRVLAAAAERISR